MVPKDQISKQPREGAEKRISYCIEKMHEATGFLCSGQFQDDDEANDSVEKEKEVIDK